MPNITCLETTLKLNLTQTENKQINTDKIQVYASCMKCLSIYLTFIFLEWICIILALASWSGLGNSIFLSSRPTVTNKGNFSCR